MVARITDRERFLRSELAEIREFMRRKTPDIVRAPMFKNLVENGGIDNGTVGFLATSGVSLAAVSGALNITGNAGGLAYQSLVLTVGAKYSLTGTSSGGTLSSMTVFNGEGIGSGAAIASTGNVNAGTRTLQFNATSSRAAMRLTIGTGTGTTVTFDDLSIWEVDPSDNAPWLRLPYGRRVGKRGFVFRDGPRLMSNEYEEIFRGDQAFIKPLVAPGVNTEFDVYCGIGA